MPSVFYFPCLRIGIIKRESTRTFSKLNLNFKFPISTFQQNYSDSAALGLSRPGADFTQN